MKNKLTQHGLRSQICSQIWRLWLVLPPKRRWQSGLVLCSTLLASFFEILSLGALFPFLALITNPDRIVENYLIRSIVINLGFESTTSLVLFFSFVFALAAIFAGIFRMFLFWVQTRLSVTIGADLSIEAFERTLHQPYSMHVGRNSSEILAGIQKVGSLVFLAIHPILLLVTSFLLLLSILSTLFIIDSFVALNTFLALAFIYTVVAFLTRRLVTKNSRIVALHTGKVTKVIQEGLGGIRDVLIDGTQQTFIREYRRVLIPMQVALANNQVVGASPRFGVEAFGMALFAFLAYELFTRGHATGESFAVPILGVLALGAQRLLPLLQQMYSAYVILRGGEASIEDALDLLEQPYSSTFFKSTPVTVEFHKCISLDRVSFRYSPQDPWVLRNVNLEIPKGGCVGIIGSTGSGKSTLIDLVMGLLNPTEGSLRVDQVAVSRENVRGWQLHISHVPQSIYLSDASITENIAFGIPTELIDIGRVKRSAQQAQIAKDIELWRSGYETLVGERGVRLSGGQRQRIGIARALYKNPNILVLDEATSALDNATETAFTLSLEALRSNMTIIIIAHRLTTLKNCDLILEVSESGIKTAGPYDRLMREAEQ
jgi:ABC-type multidrug transport system fused ATPase/permease subunit